VICDLLIKIAYEKQHQYVVTLINNVKKLKIGEKIENLNMTKDYEDNYSKKKENSSE